MPTLKAIQICNCSRIFDLFLEFVNLVSHQPTLQPRIAKEYVFANADRRTKKNTIRTAMWISICGFGSKSKGNEY